MKYSFCIHCGRKIPKSSRFCAYCGAKQPVLSKSFPKYYSSKQSTLHNKKHSIKHISKRKVDADASHKSQKWIVWGSVIFGIICVILVFISMISSAPTYNYTDEPVKDMSYKTFEKRFQYDNRRYVSKVRYSSSQPYVVKIYLNKHGNKLNQMSLSGFKIGKAADKFSRNPSATKKYNNLLNRSENDNSMTGQFLTWESGTNDHNVGGDLKGCLNILVNKIHKEHVAPRGLTFSNVRVVYCSPSGKPLSRLTSTGDHIITSHKQFSQPTLGPTD